MSDTQIPQTIEDLKEGLTNYLARHQDGGYISTAPLLSPQGRSRCLSNWYLQEAVFIQNLHMRLAQAFFSGDPLGFIRHSPGFESSAMMPAGTSYLMMFVQVAANGSLPQEEAIRVLRLIQDLTRGSDLRH